MVEVRLKIPDDLAAKLQEQLNGARITDIASEALTLYNWAVEQRAQGRLVLSSDEKGDSMKRLDMKSLENVKLLASVPVNRS